jgi:hypothetical protein
MNAGAMMGFAMPLEPGMRVQFRSVLTGKFLCSDNDNVVCDRDVAMEWETFFLHRHHQHNQNHFGIRTAFGKFVCAEPSGFVVANRMAQEVWETFRFEPAPQPGTYFIRTHHNTLLSTDYGGIVTARDTYPNASETWEVRVV